MPPTLVRQNQSHAGLRAMRNRCQAHPTFAQAHHRNIAERIIANLGNKANAAPESGEIVRQYRRRTSQSDREAGS